MTSRRRPRRARREDDLLALHGRRPEGGRRGARRSRDQAVREHRVGVSRMRLTRSVALRRRGVCASWRKRLGRGIDTPGCVAFDTLRSRLLECHLVTLCSVACARVLAARASVYRTRRRRAALPTINQLVRKGRKAAGDEEQDAGAQGQSAEARRVHARLHHDAQEAELGAAQGRPCAPDQRHGGHRLHPGHRPQPAGALDRARAWRSCEGPAGCALQDHPRQRSTAPRVSDRNQARSRYGAKKPK